MHSLTTSARHLKKDMFILWKLLHWNGAIEFLNSTTESGVQRVTDVCKIRTKCLFNVNMGKDSETQDTRQRTDVK